MSNETISVPRDWAQHYADLLEECCAYEKSEQVSALLAQPAEPVISPGDEEFSHLSTIELRGYHKGWAAASATQLAEIKRLKGLQPEAPPRPPEGDGLPRYGLRWNGPQQPLATPMDDGYWTPWHLAAQQQTQSFPTQFSALREAMENAAARRNPCQLIVGDIRIAVTYHGIKWFHTRISGDNQQHPLAIEEFDEIVASALGVKP